MAESIPILKLALGDEFERLHPMLQRQYSVTSRSGVVGCGKGVMTEVTRGRALIVLFPETGKDVGFSVENYAYVNSEGRETLTWTRVFDFEQPRRFDEYLIFSKARNGLVVLAGSHQHLAVDLKVHVDHTGALCFETAGQRLYEWRIGIPFPAAFSGVARVRESFSDEADRYEIDVSIDNKIFGHILGYKGWFHHAPKSCSAVPSHVLPKRTEPRD